MSQQMVETRAEASAPGAAMPEFDLVRVVDRTPLREEPFDHIQMENVFPPAFYRQMLDAMPAREKFHQLYHRDALRTDGSSTRLRLYLYPENLWRLPKPQRAVWGKVVAALSAPELELAFKRKFRAALEERFQMPAERVPLYPVPILVRDQPGYRIGIHADALSKAITVQFYLPSDAAQVHLGTIFHTTRADDGADRPVAMRFLPASGYAFAVQRKESWHSAPTTTESDGERRSIMLTYYVDEELKRFKRRTQRLGIFFGRYPKI
jgi:hypothetical protein